MICDQLLFADVNATDSWDAVWDGAVALRPDGWSVEVAIPFRVLRFTEASWAMPTSSMRSRLTITMPQKAPTTSATHGPVASRASARPMSGQAFTSAPVAPAWRRIRPASSPVRSTTRIRAGGPPSGRTVS